MSTTTQPQPFFFGFVSRGGTVPRAAASGAAGMEEPRRFASGAGGMYESFGCAGAADGAGGMYEARGLSGGKVLSEV